MYQAKRGWKTVTNPKILAIYNECFEEARRLGLWQGENLPLYQHKSTKTLGSCCYEHVYGETYDKAIVLNEYLLHEPERMRRTVIHEIGHAVSPVGAHHNWEWAHNTNKIAKKWGLNITRINHDKVLNDIMRKHRKAKKDSSSYRYEAYCPCCGQSWKYKTKCEIIKNPQRWTCRKCKQSLESREI